MANEFFSNEYTEEITKVVTEIQNDPSTYRGAKYMPSESSGVRKIRVEVIEATGGLTNEHTTGTDPKYIQSFGSRVIEFEPPTYKEKILYDEPKILYLRDLGNNGRNVRGIEQYISRSVDQLNRRLEARIELQRWQAIFNGGYSFQGKNITFGIPAGNRVVPIGAVWSSDGISANNSANPIQDLRHWLCGGTPLFRKYKSKAIVMNPNTARWILDNTNTRAFLTSYGANSAITGYDINIALQFLIPGLPMVDVYDGWYQTETVTNGRIGVSDGVYFIPDGYIFFETTLPGNDKIGSFVQSVNLANGTIQNPGKGKFLVIEDNTLPGTKGGPGNPFMDIIAGVNGGAKLDRAFDVLTAKVIA